MLSSRPQLRELEQYIQARDTRHEADMEHGNRVSCPWQYHNSQQRAERTHHTTHSNRLKDATAFRLFTVSIANMARWNSSLWEVLPRQRRGEVGGRSSSRLCLCRHVGTHRFVLCRRLRQKNRDADVMQAMTNAMTKASSMTNTHAVVVRYSSDATAARSNCTCTTTGHQ